MFAKIITGILAFLLLLFPNCGTLRYNYLLQTNSATIAMPKIVASVQTHDVAALETMMCKNIKQNVQNLSVEIGKLLDAIDGTITSMTWDAKGGYQGANGLGRRISQDNCGIYITTSSGKYFLGVMWETVNSFSPDERGIRYISLFDNGKEGADRLVYDISAIEGIVDWHD